MSEYFNLPGFNNDLLNTAHSVHSVQPVHSYELVKPVHLVHSVQLVLPIIASNS